MDDASLFYPFFAPGFCQPAPPFGIEPPCYYNRVLDSRRILVTGGAGYIGSHTVRLLLEQGYDVAVADDLSKGYKKNVPAKRLYEINIADTAALTELMRQMRTEAVVHFAAF